MAYKRCIHPGCRTLIHQGSRCAKHTEPTALRKARGLTGQRGSTRQWRTLRARVIAHHGHTCAQCGTTGKLHVHHRNGDAFDNHPDNLVPLCEHCHQGQHYSLGRT